MSIVRKLPKYFLNLHVNAPSPDLRCCKRRVDKTRYLWVINRADKALPQEKDVVNGKNFAHPSS